MSKKAELCSVKQSHSEFISESPLKRDAETSSARQVLEVGHPEFISGSNKRVKLLIRD